MRTPMKIVSLKHAVAALGLITVATASVSAQEARAGSRWLGWVGCWTASVPGESAFATFCESVSWRALSHDMRSRNIPRSGISAICIEPSFTDR